MPKVLRTSKIWTLTKREGDVESPLCASVTFRSIYQLALLELHMANPSLTERQARLIYNRTGMCLLWDKDQFETIEEAMWSPIGKLAKIDKIPVK